MATYLIYPRGHYSRALGCGAIGWTIWERSEVIAETGELPPDKKVFINGRRFWGKSTESRMTILSLIFSLYQFKKQLNEGDQVRILISTKNILLNIKTNYRRQTNMDLWMLWLKTLNWFKKKNIVVDVQWIQKYNNHRVWIADKLALEILSRTKTKYQNVTIPNFSKKRYDRLPIPKPKS